MKVGIFQDVHANLPALQTALEVFRAHNCAHLVHVGDLVGIGPYPRECMEMALSVPELTCIMGNHDHWYAYGLPDPVPEWMSSEEVAHQNWTHAQLGSAWKKGVKNWPFMHRISFGQDKEVVFQHYARLEGPGLFKPIEKSPDGAKLDALFDSPKGVMLFYGHNHVPSDIQGSTRYVNLGSAGCHTKAEVRLGILDESLDLMKLTVPYDDTGLLTAFEERQVPAREFIRTVFIVRA